MEITRKYKEYEIKAIKQENEELRNWLELPSRENNKFIIASILNVVYSNYFWVSVKDSSKVKIDDIVWQEDYLIGLVKEIKDNFLRIVPITDPKIKIEGIMRNGERIILQGEKSYMKILISNSDKNLSGDVFYNKALKIGKIKNGIVRPYKASIKSNWVCINIS